MKPFIMLERSQFGWACTRIHKMFDKAPRALIHVRRLKTKAVIYASWGWAKWTTGRAERLFDHSQVNEIIRKRIDSAMLAEFGAADYHYHETSHDHYEIELKNWQFRDGELADSIAARDRKAQRIVRVLCATLTHGPTAEEIATLYAERERRDREMQELFRTPITPVRPRRHLHIVERPIDPDARRITQ